MKILNSIQKLGLACAFITLPAVSSPLTMQTQSKDIFVKKDIPPEGTTDKTILYGAPIASVNICGEEKFARIVVDLGKNVLYKYDSEGNAIAAYLIASGKKSTPTDKGIRIVTHIEKYPYSASPEQTRRHNKPNDYGPRIICLNKLNPATGEQSPTGEFIHGNNNPASLGKYTSLGCIRMDNTVIKELAEEVKRGDIVVIQ